MGALDAVKFLMADHGDIGSGFRKTFAEDKPFKSILQRNEKTLDDILKMFDWKEDDALWCDEYDKGDQGNDVAEKLIRYRRRVCFELCGWREFKEDFGRGDVSCMRDMRTPLVTSRSPLKAMKDDFDGK